MNSNNKTLAPLLAPLVYLACLTAPGAVQAAVQGIVGATGSAASSFALRAADGSSSQPDGAQIYSWGYGCDASNGSQAVVKWSGQGPSGTCPGMQLPGPTLIVTEGDTVTVTLTICPRWRATPPP